METACSSMHSGPKEVAIEEECEEDPAKAEGGSTNGCANFELEQANWKKFEDALH